MTYSKCERTEAVHFYATSSVLGVTVVNYTVGFIAASLLLAGTVAFALVAPHALISLYHTGKALLLGQDPREKWGP